MTPRSEPREKVDTWQQITDRIREAIPPPYYSSIIAPLRVISVENDSITVGVPNSFTKDVILSRFIHEISSAASQVCGRNVDIILTVSSSPEIVGTIASHDVEDEVIPENGDKKAGSFKPTPQKKYSFENFVVGDSNKFAYSAALMVAEFPGHNYNPLFIYGGTGLGKTHLLKAIQDYSQTMNPNIKVKYVQTSRFIDEFIATLTLKRDKATFDNEYINNHIVMFDDIQALGGTEACQNKFFDIFNLLYGSNSHIVLSSDRPPVEIAKLSARIRSRFVGGLMLDIKPPDLETRLAILRMKARAETVEVPDEALVFIASKAKDNIRTLEGLLNKVVAYARLYGTRIHLQMVQEVLKDQVAESDRSKKASVDLIQNLVSNYYCISREDLISKSRSRPLVKGRQVAMYLCRELTDETLIRIGSQFGGRDHSTVLHSCKKVESLLKQKRDVFHEVSDITNIINKSV